MWPRGVGPMPSVEAPRGWVRRDATERGHALGPSSALGRGVGEEVSGTARRGPGGAGIGPLGREPEMGEDPADDPGILEGGDDAHAAATARTGEHFEGKGAPHQVGPRPIPECAGSLALELGNAGRARVRGGFPQSDARPFRRRPRGGASGHGGRGSRDKARD